MIYVVTAVHNRRKITEDFVKLLNSQTCKVLQLVLVDDGCDDGTPDMVKSLMPTAIILQGDGNLWWGGGLDLAFRWLVEKGEKGSYVMFSNDDVYFENDYIEKALAILREKPDVILTGHGVSKQTGKQKDGAVDFKFPEVAGYRINSDKAYGNCASTRSLFFSLEQMKKAGGFHPKALPHYGSDYEWTIRACRRNKTRIYCTKEVCYEVNEETTGIHERKKITVKKLFSKRSMSNPIYKITFAAIAAPWGKKTISTLWQGIRLVFRIFVR